LKETATQSHIACLLDMAEAETNPVLQVIPSDSPLKENKKYPPELLQFNGLGWRAYYHCHPASRAGDHRFKGEHGHFHIFVRIKDEPEKWSHFVALAMNNMGQPIGFFTVNQWVTGEEWESAKKLIKYLDDIPFSEQKEVVEMWLLSLLIINRDLIAAVLVERDNIITVKKGQLPDADIKKDKGLYLLSEVALDYKKIFNIRESG